MTKELQIPQEIDVAAFISKEAHDLRSPFNRALGFLKLVLEGMDGPISEQAKDDLMVSYLNLLYTLGLMNGLVDMARLGRGESEVTLDFQSMDYVLQKTISEWQRKYHKENFVQIEYSTPEIQIEADEIMIRHGIRYWISYVNEFVQENVVIHLDVEEQTDSCLLTIQSSGKKLSPPAESDLMLNGYAAKKILELHRGELLSLEETEQGAMVKFSLPKTS
jgi:K+-sensing histidine kinase KdpD